MIKKGYLQVSFGWLFAIIVGAFILFLAIYASSKIINRGNEAGDIMTSKELGILTNPLETGFETGKTNRISVRSETRIYNDCETTGIFGNQIISASKKSLGKWTSTELRVRFKNKYFFSDKEVEGRDFYLFSKPFKFPFKVSDLIYLTSDKDSYCFINAPADIKEELQYLNQKNIDVDNCSSNSIKVCFIPSSPECDIKVDYSLGYVEKSSQRVYFYSNALMYAAIFSDPLIYECQIKRLMKRTEQLALIYFDKAKIVSGKECNSNLNLLMLANSAKNINNSAQLPQIIPIVEDIQNKNDVADCKLW